MAFSGTQMTLLLIIGLILLAHPVHGFGAGNIGSTSKIEGQNWRHGDIEDVLLTLASSRAMGGGKFGKLDVKRVYFGNWLRDYSQAVDVGTVKYVSAEAIRILLWVLGFMSFGFGTKEFEVTTERLGCYRPEEHIDNPKDYADNEDATQYDPRLRGPVNERRELAIDPELGMKNYIASENIGITTSAGLVRNLFGRSIELGRRYNRNKNNDDLYEALRLLGTGCHCLEDFSAHSNYTELALIELGERDIFPHVGSNTQVRLRGARNSVYPLVTGTFGGVDFLHSVTGEFDDKTTQSEIQELEGTLQEAQNQGENTSILQDLLSKVPDGVFGGADEAGKADDLKTNAAQHQMQNTRVSPRQPEEWLQYLNDVQQQIYPILEWHDEIMKSITETIENIPILPDLIEQIQDQVNMFVFSLLAPFILPIIKQIKTELSTGSNAIIQSSVAKQHIVFSDDRSSDPTHSMLSKDHFSNVLNEPAGKVAGQVLGWVVPQMIACWDDEGIDVNRTLNRIIRGVLHHPALRDFGDDGASDGRRLMFEVVERWWNGQSDDEKDGLRDQLSRRGVESGRNHKPGVHDHGHGSGKKLGMPTASAAQSSGAPGGSSVPVSQLGQLAGSAVGGGVLGSLVDSLASGLGGDILGGGFEDNEETYKRTSYGDDGSRTDTITQLGSAGNRYGQAQYTRTEGQHGQRQDQYTRFEQSGEGKSWRTENHNEERTNTGEYRQESRRYGGAGSYDNQYSEPTQAQEYGSGGYGRTPEPQEDQPRRFGGEDDGPRHHGGRQHPPENSPRRETFRGDYGHQQEDYGQQGNAYEYTDQPFSRSRPDDEPSSYGHREDRPTFGSDDMSNRFDNPGFKTERRHRDEPPRFGGGSGGGQDHGEESDGFGRRTNNEDEDSRRHRSRRDHDEGYGQSQNYGGDNSNYGY